MGFFDWVALYVLCFFGFAALVECCRRLAIREVHIYYHTAKEGTQQTKENDDEDDSIPSSVASKWSSMNISHMDDR